MKSSAEELVAAIRRDERRAFVDLINSLSGDEARAMAAQARRALEAVKTLRPALVEWAQTPTFQGSQDKLRAAIPPEWLAEPDLYIEPDGAEVRG